MRLVLIVLAVAFGMASAPAFAEIQYFSETVKGKRITVLVPDGYCLLDASEESDARFIEFQKTVNKGVNRYLLGFANCGFLKLWRSGDLAKLNDYGFYLTSIRSIPGRHNITQAKLNRALKKNLSKYVSRGIKQGEEKVRQVLDEMASGVEINETKSLGVLGEDRAGLYFGMLQKLTDEDGEAVTVSGVYSSLVLKRQLITLYMYRDYEGEKAFDDLVAFVKYYAAVLHRKN